MSSPARLVEILAAKGALVAGWESAVATVPRELFVPDSIDARGRAVLRSSQLAEWRTWVYDDVALTTQINDGDETAVGIYQLPTSSSSMPSVMLHMLDLLQVNPGQRVLEAGAGTGYNAAWLAHRLGSQQVTSVDIDPVLVERAAKNVAAAGYTPGIVCGDADQGWPPGAPYDRLIATYTVPAVPYAWIEQTPRGRIVTPWGGSFFPHSFLSLDVEAGVGRGRFSGFPSFMRTRNQRPHRGYLRDFLHHTDQATTSHTAVNPWHLVGDSDALFYIGLTLPDAWYVLVEAADDSGEATLWLLADDRGSWASVDYAPGRTDYVVESYGPRQLWDETEAAYRTWEHLGHPTRDRTGLTVTADGERVWLDTEDHIIV
ncbi:methyltransferase domain-containing protein [Streptomyces albipurpureus]|uniref:Protein-L-isoaspartate O-methyltransferase n=1 Tax=Streptomyces albipurpureus TaxID=2897419 RepID=A0ABT0UHB3_9ACTN|nr:methyltransferase domain-containing protein [Streptomyces sp. CWNU-1]MCM2387809.1 methyltransferase domain-containing protein [Streptomyces sp. CWNU-1]